MKRKMYPPVTKKNEIRFLCREIDVYPREYELVLLCDSSVSSLSHEGENALKRKNCKIT